MSVIQELKDAVAGAAEAVGPSVVGLGRGWGRGSGVVTAAGVVLTNAHVLRGEEVAVAFADGRTEHGRVAGADADLDLAAIAVDTGDAPPVAWEPERPGAVGIGEPVFALANPGGRGLRATFGMVSATGRSFRGPRGRRIGGSLEHTAPLPRGSSGGPLVDAEHRLLGLNSIRLEGGLILALPADAAMQRRAEALASGEAAERAAASGSRSRPRGPRGGCARPSGCPSATACSSAASWPTARPARRASSAATCSSASTAAPVVRRRAVRCPGDRRGPQLDVAARHRGARRSTVHFSS